MGGLKRTPDGKAEPPKKENKPKEKPEGISEDNIEPGGSDVPEKLVEYTIQRPRGRDGCWLCPENPIEDGMTECDGCFRRYHTGCLKSPRRGEGSWDCPKCIFEQNLLNKAEIDRQANEKRVLKEQEAENKAKGQAQRLGNQRHEHIIPEIQIEGIEREGESSDDEESEDDGRAPRSQRRQRQPTFRDETLYQMMGDITMTLKGTRDILHNLTAPKPMPRPEYTPTERQLILDSIPGYSGVGVKEWIRFKTAYDTTAELVGATQIENFGRLKTKLTGEARNKVSNILLDVKQVHLVMPVLEKAYGKKKDLEDLSQKEFEKLQPEGKGVKALESVRNLIMDLIYVHQYLGKEDYLKSKSTLIIAQKKVPTTQLKKWAGFDYQNQRLVDAGEPGAAPYTVEDLAEFLEEEIGMLKYVNEVVSRDEPEKADKGAKPKKAHVMPIDSKVEEPEKTKKDKKSKSQKKAEPEASKEPLGCVFCDKKNHDSKECQAAPKMELGVKLAKLKAKGICHVCLQQGHKGKDCKSGLVCGLNGCDKKTHHALVHPGMSYRPKQDTPTKPEPPKEEPSVPRNLDIPEGMPARILVHGRKEMSEILYGVVPGKVINPSTKESMKCGFMLDQGSAMTLLDHSLFIKLGLRGVCEPITKVWTGGVTVSNPNSHLTSIDIIGPNGILHHVDEVRTDDDLGLPLQTHDQTLYDMPHLRGLPKYNFDNMQPLLLIGITHMYLITARDCKEAGPKDPCAYETRLGWVYQGVKRKPIDPNTRAHVMMHRMVMQPPLTKENGDPNEPLPQALYERAYLASVGDVIKDDLLDKMEDEDILEHYYSVDEEDPLDSDLEDWDEPQLELSEEHMVDRFQETNSFDLFSEPAGLFVTNLLSPEEKGEVITLIPNPKEGEPGRKPWTNSDPGPTKAIRDPTLRDGDEDRLAYENGFSGACTKPDCYRLINYELNEVILRAWTEEAYPIEAPPGDAWLLNDEEKICKDIMTSGIRPVREGPPPYRWEVPMTWDPKAELPSSEVSYYMSEKRMKSTEKRARKDGMIVWLNDYLKKMIDREYIRELDEVETHLTGNSVAYVPFFYVLNRNKQEWKPRLVYDFKAPVHGISINDCLLTPKDMMPPLRERLIDFRLYPFAVCGDIEQMFHQVRVPPKDASKQRLLWRWGVEGAVPRQFEMDVLAFGPTCAPAMAMYAKNHNAHVNGASPRALKAIERDYVDNSMESYPTIEEAIETTLEIIDIDSKGSFNLRDIVANNPAITSAVPEAKLSKIMEKEFKDEQRSETILGTTWNIENDCFEFDPPKVMNKIKEKTNEDSLFSHPTKRAVASFTAQIYDPMGWWSHLTIQGKILLQDVWLSGVDWDDRVKPAELKQWNDFVAMMNATTLHQMPRCFSKDLTTARKIELHMFSDASTKAFAAAIYLRVETADGRIDTSLVLGKSKVGSMRNPSIPRMELEAALMGARLYQDVMKVLKQEKINVDRSVFWTDSKIVLCWLRSKRIADMEVYVKNRVYKTLDLTKGGEWRHVPTDVNSADGATKLLASPTWTTGPPFLKLGESDWPVESEIQKKLELIHDEKLFVGVVRTTLKLPKMSLNIEDYSSWERLVVHVSLLLKWIDWMRDKKPPMVENYLTLADRERGKNALYRLAQRQAMSEDFEHLRIHKTLPIGSPLRGLNPHFDDYKVLRHHSRIERANLPDEVRTPVILPRRHHVTFLIAKAIHEENRHMLVNTQMDVMKAQYQVLALRELFRDVQKACQKCKNERAVPQHPRMAPLHANRLQPYVKPFTWTGVDMAGPFKVYEGLRGKKECLRYLMLFTCLTTRATHLEIALDQTSRSFMNCILRMTSRRGFILHLFADNGKNFVGMEKELAKVLAVKSINFHHIYPRSPNWGGAWETMVKLAKRALYNVTGKVCLREEAFRTHIAQIEGMLNRRPLVEIPLAGPDDEVLTPFHFILLCSGNAHAENFPEDDLRVVGRVDWANASALSMQWWDLWTRQYLRTLRTREYWNRDVEPIKQGDIVVVVDPKKPRLGWVKARVLRIMPSNDRVARAAMIYTSTGSYVRPVHRLIRLDVQAPLPAPEGVRHAYIGVISARTGDEHRFELPVFQVPANKDIMEHAKLLIDPDEHWENEYAFNQYDGYRSWRDLDEPEGGQHPGFCPKIVYYRLYCEDCEATADLYFDIERESEEVRGQKAGPIDIEELPRSVMEENRPGPSGERPRPAAHNLVHDFHVEDQDEPIGPTGPIESTGSTQPDRGVTGYTIRINNIFMILIMLLYVLVLPISGMVVTPLNRTGLAVMNFGEAYAKVGEMTWELDTGVSPAEDYRLIQNELGRLDLACQALAQKSTNSVCTDEVNNLKSMVQISKLNPRSKRFAGVLGGLKYLVFGTDEHESEVLALRERQRIAEAHTREALLVTAKTLENSERINVKRFNELLLKLNNTRGWVAAMVRSPEKFTSIVTEQIDQLIEMFLLHFIELDKKYELLDRGVDLLSNKEFEKALAVVRSRLESDTMVPPLERDTLKRLIRAEKRMDAGNIKIMLHLPVIFAERFHRAYLVPLPDPETGVMIDMEPMDVCYNSVTQNYFVMDNLEYQQAGENLVLVKNAVFQSAKQKAECFTAHLFEKRAETKRICRRFRNAVAQGPNEIYALALPGHNQFLISTTRPETVIIQCGIDIRPMARERTTKVTTAIIVTNSGCRINTLTGFIVTDPTINTEIKLTKVYLSEMKMPTFKEAPPRALDMTPWVEEDSSYGIRKILDELEPEYTEAETVSWKLIIGISVPSSFVVLIIAVTTGICCYRKQTTVANKADIELAEFTPPSADTAEPAQASTESDLKKSRDESEDESRDELQPLPRFPTAPKRFSFTI